MNEELSVQLKKDLLELLLPYYRRCKVYIRFIDDYDILQITLIKEVTPCYQFIFNQVYIDPLINLSKHPKDYAEVVAYDFKNKANKWIKLQFTGT